MNRIVVLLVIATLLGGCGAGQKKALSVCEGKLFVCHADLDKSTAGAGRCQGELGGVRRVETLVQARVDDLSRLAAGLRGSAPATGATWEIRDGALVATLPGAMLFEVGESGLTVAGKETLAGLAAALSSTGERAIIVVGHADDANAGKKKKGSKTDNWSLSLARGLSAAQALEAGGLAPARVTAAGRGDRDPGGTGDGRRLELIIAPAGDEMSELRQRL